MQFVHIVAYMPIGSPLEEAIMEVNRLFHFLLGLQKNLVLHNEFIQLRPRPFAILIILINLSFCVSSYRL